MDFLGLSATLPGGVKCVFSSLKTFCVFMFHVASLYATKRLSRANN